MTSPEPGDQTRWWSGLPRPLLVAAGWAGCLLVVTAGVYLLARLVVYLSIVTIPLILALLFSALLRPVQRRLERAGATRVVAAGLTLAVALVAFAGLVALVVLRTAANADQLAAQATATLDDLQATLRHGVPGFRGIDLSVGQDRFAQWLDQHRSDLATTIYTGIDLTLRVLVGILLTVLLTFILLYDGERLWRTVSRSAGPAWEARLLDAGATAWDTLSGFLHGTVVIATFHGIVIGASLWLLGVPLAVVLAVLVFVGSFVPIAGALVAGGLAVLVTLATLGPGPAAIVLAVLLVTNQTEAHVLQPVLMRRFIQVHPLVTVLAVTALGFAWGVPGALIAVPLAAVVQRVLPILAGSTANRQPPGEAPGTRSDDRPPGSADQPASRS